MAWGNAIRRAFRPSRAAEGPRGVPIKVKTHNVPGAEESGRALPGPIWWALLVAVVFYVLAHFSIIVGVWPVHGTSPGAGGTLMRDALALVAWLLVLFVLRRMKYRGTWGIVVFPILIFLLSRPAQFQAFTDPSYQARGPARAEANDLKATRSRLSTIERTYSEERRQVVYQGPPPPLPDPFAQAVRQETRGFVAKSTTYLPVFLAPLLVLVGFALTRGRYLTRWLRERRVFVFGPAILAFFVMAAFVNPATGKLAGTTPWELLLPVFVGIWAAYLADDAYNLGQPGQVLNRRRLAQLFAYGALPILPFLWIRELGLTVVLASSLAAMLLVGTRRGWWGALLMTVWAAMVVVVFNIDDRSSTRLQLAYHPYKDLSAMTEEQAEYWAGKLHQIKLFDANYLEGGLLGEGPGRGHGETAPNAADDGFFTLVAAQWGWAGTVALVLVYTLFLVELLSAAVRERGAFERTMITGLAMLIGVPFWLAALGDARVIPLTGVAAAFAAHGGAKLLASALAVGVIAGFSHRHREDERLEQALAPPPSDASQGVRIR